MGKGGESAASTTVSRGAVRKITPEEVGKHRIPGDAWMVCKGKVYDVSNWEDHPGGTVIFSHAGDDFTDIFAAFHPPSAFKEMQKFYIGELDESGIKGKELEKHQAQRRFEEGYRDLRNRLIAMGMFNANPLYYVYKVLSTLSIWAVAVYCAVKSDSFWVHMLGALLMGLFWQQSGWLAHDFIHHQVFKNRFLGDLSGIFIGNVWQGFSLQWWKTKHNTHHAVPNLHESSPLASDGDPDIDTMPLLAWSKRMARGAKDSAFGRFMIRHQAWFYFPLLLGARLAWNHQSWLFCFGGDGKWVTKNAEIDMKKNKHIRLEQIGISIHYAWLLYVLSCMPLLDAVLYFFIAQTSCGLFLAFVFGLGHNGMAVYPADERPDFWKLQVSTTRNVTSNWFSDWFCGGLQYQVDHHLFPSLPRHNLGKVHKLVHQFCIDYNVRYVKLSR
jgi:fatty acid desaturase/predicted heme/steroid binding protein